MGNPIKKTRGDSIKWIDKDSINVYEKRVVDKLSKFIKYINSTCYTAIKHFESHYACCEPCRFYKRYIDQFQNHNGRKYSVVLYLNESWTTADGGEIRLYPKDTASLDFLPLGGSVIFFKVTN